jgi:hypothetical protein
MMAKILSLTAMLFACCRLAAGDGEVLWWLVGSDYQSITATNDKQETFTAGSLGVTDVRVRYESSDGTVSGYLSLYGVNDDGSVSSYDGSQGLGADHGVGLPAEYFADLSGITDSSYNFIIELGNWADGGWVRTSMESEKVSMTYLYDNSHIAKWENTVPSYATPWKPLNFSVVPEPSSGLMMMVGMALLALRRKSRRGAES